ncbi:MAG TPA: hypothetical protein VKC34_13500 [Blastocatellia bacterium]|nr:hypothetical protein [Blastocatellia bacterium]
MMSSKNDFTPDEWKALLRAPMMVGHAIAGAAPSGRVGYVQEMKAVADAIVDASEQAAAGPLVQAVVGEIRSNAAADSRGPTETVSAADIKGRAIEACGRAASILRAKADAKEGEAYKAWLLDVGARVATAAKEGGFLGLGGARVSRGEEEVLSEIAAALEANG